MNMGVYVNNRFNKSYLYNMYLSRFDLIINKHLLCLILIPDYLCIV